MAIFVDDFDEGGAVRAVAESGERGVDHRKVLTNVVGGVAQIVLGNKVRGHGREHRRDDEREMRAVGLLLVHLDVNKTFAAHDAPTDEYGPHHSEGDFAKDYHVVLRDAKL